MQKCISRLLKHTTKWRIGLNWGDGTREIFPQVYLVGSIGKYNDFETIPEIFYIERDDHIIKDQMDDEQLLVIEEGDGLAIFSGCSHKGIINCIEHVKTQFPGREIHTLVAGMHLMGASQDVLDRTVKYLAKSNIDRIIPLHCTGLVPVGLLRQALGDRCQIFTTGDRL